MPTEPNRPHSIRFLLLGATLLLVGLAATWRWQPEWQVGDLNSRRFFSDRYLSLAETLEIDLSAMEPRVELQTLGHLVELGRALGGGFFDYQKNVTGALEVLVASSGFDDAGRRGTLEVVFDLVGRPTSITWEVWDVEVFINPNVMRGWPGVERCRRQLVRPGESLGDEIHGEQASAVFFGSELGNSDPPQYIAWGVGPVVQVSRLHGGIDEFRDDLFQRRLSHILLFFARRLLLFFVVGLVLVFLLIRRRVDPVNGALLGLLGVLSLLLIGGWQAVGMGGWLSIAVFSMYWGPWLFILWSVGESWVRTSNEGRPEAIDALRGGHLGPHVGSAVACGLIGGAALAGLRLLSIVIAGSAPWLVALRSSAALPIATPDRNPFVQGAFMAGLALFGLGFALNFGPLRRRPLLAVSAIALATLGVAPVAPWPAALVVALVCGVVFLAVFRRAGILGLLVAGLAAYLWPLAAFSMRHLDWLQASAWATWLPLLGLTGVAWIGLRRGDDVDEPRLHQPAFLRRLDDERQLRYEMRLLARMQSALLPAAPPRFDGWDLAATSMLANEVGGDLYDFVTDGAGRLWIAAGDVSGHGYSCSIGHAMTKAALVGAISKERRPSEVLSEIDRILRTLSSDRWFTAMALVRLDLDTGEAWIANAGYPYPVLVAAGQANEVELPGLPLGQGPARVYRDQQVEIPPGGTLVLYSDGLSEAFDSRGETAYGFERPGAVVAEQVATSASSVLKWLLADWRRHCGGADHSDDTTVVVVHRFLTD